MHTAKSLVMTDKITESGDGDIVIPIIGIPFGGPVKLGAEGADLKGEYFSKSTEIGPLTTALTYFDHGKDSEWIPNEFKSLGFGNRLIGKADMQGKTDEGILYNIIISQREKYKGLLKRLFSEGILDASSRALYRDTDPSDKRHIIRWDVIAIDVTPHPANPNAAPLLKSLALEFGGQSNAADVLTGSATQQLQQIFSKLKSLTDSQNGSGADAADKIREAVNLTINTAANNPQAAGNPETDQLLRQILEKLGQLERIEKRLGDTEGIVLDLQTAIPQLGEAFVNAAINAANLEKRKSAAEIDAENLAKNRGASQKLKMRGAPGWN